LQREFDLLAHHDEHLEELQAETELQQHRYQKLAKELSSKRTPAAERLEARVNQKLKQLSMGNCRFRVSLATLDKPAAYGQDCIEFLISTIPGRDPQALHKVASGGELSRISLAIQVVIASKTTMPVLVFDEVDVGIGGTVANTVGELLRKLAGNCQILCVTHLPQVAAQGHQHLSVRKKTQRKQVATELSVLNDDAKIDEIARMLGGVKLTEQSRAHAEAMLAAH
jgi:DNA repair protein RecN (Recombination protein N)